MGFSSQRYEQSTMEPLSFRRGSGGEANEMTPRTKDYKSSFLQNYDDLKAEDIMLDKLEEISDELDKALKRRHGKK